MKALIKPRLFMFINNKWLFFSSIMIILLLCPIISIFLASHNMAEVERLCDSVIMMKKGKIIDQGTSKEIINRHGRANLEETFLKIVRSEDEVA